jgi:hypothetical protein
MYSGKIAVPPGGGGILRYIRKGRNLQTTLAQELCNQLGEYNRNYFTLDDIANIERLLNIQIKIVAAECFNFIIYSGPERDVKVYLYKNGNHFDTINNMTGFYGQSYYCEKCDKPYQHKDNHKCKKGNKICILCLKPKHKEESKQRIYCEKCNRYCFNQECLENHSEVCGSIFFFFLVCWLTGCTPKQKPTVNSVIQCNSSKSDCVPVTGNAQLNL